MRGFHFTVPSPSGNAGDDVLAHATRELLGQIGIREWTLCNLRDHVTPQTVAHANTHDLVVVGGGGLFLADTNPNEVSGWQWKCPLPLLRAFRRPLVVLAVGYNVFRNQGGFPPIFERHVAALLDQAAVFSVRNHGSRTALAARHGLCVDHVQVCPCPSLMIQPRTQRVGLGGVGAARDAVGSSSACCAEKTLLESGGTGSARCAEKTPRESRGMGCWRVGIQLAGDRIGLRVPDMAGFTAELDATVVGIRERGLEPVFLEHNWNPASNLAELAARHGDVPRLDFSTLWQRGDVDELLWTYRDLAAVIAMRGHGQMIPFGQGTPVISWISHDKLGWFLDDAGMRDWGVEAGAPNLSEQTLALLDRITETTEWHEAHAAAAERFRVATGRTLARIRAAL